MITRVSMHVTRGFHRDDLPSNIDGFPGKVALASSWGS